MIQKLKAIAKERGYKIFTRPFELNIWGFRSKETNSGRFDDELFVFYNANVLSSKIKWQVHHYKATTDPGTFWLNDPMNPQGTAILKAGQYLDAYGISLHGRKAYYALCQIHKPVTVIRDYNRDGILDFFNGIEETGMFGINIHRARTVGEAKVVDKFSAGCQVFAFGKDFSTFMELCERHRVIYGNVFSYTLIDFRSLRRLHYKRLAIGATLVGMGIAGIYSIQNLLNS